MKTSFCSIAERWVGECKERSCGLGRRCLGRANIKRESLTQISESQQALAIYFTMGKTTTVWQHGSMGAEWAQGQTGRKDTVPASEASRAGRGREWK